jgi:nucleoside-diphosphate-sugar epimerase
MSARVQTIAVAGAKGYVGAQIARAVAGDPRYRLLPVSRGDDAAALFAEADAVIHSANPARRVVAEQDPQRDFAETVEKTAAFLEAARGKRFILVSSLSCRTQLATSYGRNRRACELLALAAGALVVRLGPMFGGSRTRDSLHDMLLGKQVYVSADTRYAYVDVAWAARQIVAWIDGPSGLREIGARNAVRLGDIAAHFGSPSCFTGPDDTQIPEGFTDGPDANEAIAFAEWENLRQAEWLG